MKDFKNIFLVSISTVGSRISGLFRDIAVFSVLGASALNSAFLFAFTLPNLFRRMLGEGALSSALIPIFSEQLEHRGREGAFRFFNQVLSWAIIALVGMVGVGVLCLASIRLFSGLEERWYWASDLGIIMMPYMLFVCMAAVVSAVLNVIGRFGVPALTAVWLNFAMIVAIGGSGFFISDDLRFRVNCLCVGVLVGGALQFLLPAYALMKEGWKPRFELKFTKQLFELLRLFIPGVIGAAIFQVNIGMTRLFAFSLDDSAVSIIYLANRLIEAPLGIFAIAITTVFFPNLARFAAKKNHIELGDAYGRGMRLILGITVPASVGLIVLREPILQLFFEWGRFNAHDVAITAPILMIYAFAVPFYSFATFITRGFHAVKDTKTPVRIAFWMFIVNLLLTVVFMFLWEAPGLAIANVGAVIFQTVLLHCTLEKKETKLALKSFFVPVIQVLFSSIIMGMYCIGSWLYIQKFFTPTKELLFVGLILIISSAAFIYYCLLGICRFKEQRELNQFMISMFRRKTQMI